MSKRTKYVNKFKYINSIKLNTHYCFSARRSYLKHSKIILPIMTLFMFKTDCFYNDSLNLRIFRLLQLACFNFIYLIYLLDLTFKILL